MKVFFVGVHYNPGMEALDSRTISGKRIDAIISQLPQGVESEKTNLFPTPFYPNKVERKTAINPWNKLYKPQPNDLIFLLGGKVLKDFTLKHNGIVSVYHPSKVMSKAEVEKYISTAVKIITDKINEK